MSLSALKKTLIIILFAIVIAVPLFYFKWGVYPYTLAKELFFQMLAEVLFFLWLALALKDKRYRPRWTPWFIALLVFLGVETLTAITGVDFLNSLWSTYERSIGIVALYHFAALAVVASSLGQEIPWKKLGLASIGTAAFVSTLAWMQLSNPNLLLNETPGNRPGATFGNPTFFADYLLFNIFIGVFLLLDWWKRREGGDKARTPAFAGATVFLLATLVANLAALFQTQTRGDILGLGTGLFAMLVFFTFRPPEVRLGFLRKRALYAGVLAVLLLGGSIFYLTKSSSFWSHVPGLSRFKDVSFSLSQGDTDFGPRLISYHAAWEGFLEKPLLGWGPENFDIVFNKFYDPKSLEYSYQETRFDKPHDFVLEFLVSGGVPLALAYFAMIAAVFYEASKLKNKLWMTVVIPMVLAYIVSDLFVFETIGGLLMCYLVFGVVDGKYRSTVILREGGGPMLLNKRSGSTGPGLRRGDGKSGDANKEKEHGYLPLLFLGIGLVTAYFVNIPTLYASYNQYLGFSYVASGNGHQEQGMEYFREASAAVTPYRWNFERDWATDVAQTYFYYPGYISDQDAKDGVAAFESSRDAHPLDAYNHYALVDIYNEVAGTSTASLFPPQTYLCDAEHEAQVALQLSPNRQEVYISLAKTKSLEASVSPPVVQCDGQSVAYDGQYGNKAALALLKYSLNLDPKVADSHFYYGILAFAIGDAATSTADAVTYDTIGYNEVEQATALGRQWGKYTEPRAVASYLADFYNATNDETYLNRAIDLYNTTLSLEPGDAETEIKLGIAYFERAQADLKNKDAAGEQADVESARTELQAAGKQYDLSQDPSLQPILRALGM
ncbi:MAG TPA: O-antigen ligase family protein [Candidatus Paceibacterota bacterium]|nr:O-antigen ligase family protein [Candidatus Paceibacterota bacterium]